MKSIKDWLKVFNGRIINLKRLVEVLVFLRIFVSVVKVGGEFSLCF